MIRERENTHPKTKYGKLTLRQYDIDGNNIDAFYDADGYMVFVLDNTINANKPNVLLVINPDADKKWDDMLANDYGVDLETIRPKVDNKYQKLDIEYSGLAVYDNLISAYESGEDLSEHLNQLSVLRDSAARHSAMMRLNVANDTISKTNVTIVKTKETILRLQARLKSLRAKLSATKKEIGKVATKQSASKILKLESQIDATAEKLKRAQKRLESAQKRLEIATVDAELASDLLNQPAVEIKASIKEKPSKNKPVMVAPKYEVQTVEEDTDDDADDDVDAEDENKDEEIEPLFNEDPQILDNDNAFMPINFEPPASLTAEPRSEIPVLNQNIFVDEPQITEKIEERPVLESMTPVATVSQQDTSFVDDEPVATVSETVVEEKPVLESMVPVAQSIPVVEEPVTPVVADAPEFDDVPVAEMTPPQPVVNKVVETVPNDTPVISEPQPAKSKFVYYVLLIGLIILSVFTLWLYQKNITGDTKPVLTAKMEQTQPVDNRKVILKKKATVTEQPVMVDDDSEPLFLDEVPSEPESKEIVEPVVMEEENTNTIDSAPVVIDAVPVMVSGSVPQDDENETGYDVINEDEILASKPVYEPGGRHDEMFVSEEYIENTPEYADEEDVFYDEEEAQYQAEQDNQYYEE